MIFNAINKTIMNNSSILIFFLLIGLSACNSDKKKADAYGNFEATEIIVSSESAGRIASLRVENGMELKAGEVVGKIDSIQAGLKIEQINAQKVSVSEKVMAANAQVKTVETQIKGIEKDITRIDKLFADGATTRQQYDDVHNRYEILKTQLETARAQLKAASSETGTLQVQNQQATDMLSKCTIVNPINGTVLERYAEAGELANPGTPLYKIADISSLDLKVYIAGDQLTQFKIGDKVRVYVDADKKNNTELEGVVNWISAQSEFTPKIIQTKEERVNMVYAMKIRVANNGILKIGMPGEIRK